MTLLQLEQLVSGYIDRELPPSRMLEVERLLHNDPEAKKLYDSFLLIRKEIKAIPKRNLPVNFQKNLFRQIEMEVVPYSGSLVRQGTDTLKVTQDIKSLQETSGTTSTPSSAMTWMRFQMTNTRLSGVLQRFRNPRLLIFPVLAILLGLAFYFSDVSKTNSLRNRPAPGNATAALDTAKNHDDATQQPYYPPPPLPAGGVENPQNDHPAIILNDAETITVEIGCRLAADAKTSQYIPKLLADSGFEWVMRQNGTRMSTTYEFKTTPEHLIPILTQLHGNRKDVLSLTLPPNFLQFFIRTDSDSPPKTIGPGTPILVRINVM
ncbi:MAG: hypothetical protein FWC50_06510 [Planctomycetaceae bacterium]|nr:hypothetical protein [Planctomycetaceae bacterium]